MRVATYNVENLFSRVHAMNGDDPDQTSVVLAAVAELQRLIAHDVYTEADKARMLEILRESTRRPGRAVRFSSRKRAGGFTPTARSWPRGGRIGSARSNGGAT